MPPGWLNGRRADFCGGVPCYAMRCLVLLSFRLVAFKSASRLLVQCGELRCFVKPIADVR